MPVQSSYLTPTSRCDDDLTGHIPYTIFLIQGAFFLLVLPKLGYVPGLVEKSKKKIWSMGFYKGI